MVKIYGIEGEKVKKYIYSCCIYSEKELLRFVYKLKCYYNGESHLFKDIDENIDVILKNFRRDKLKFVKRSNFNDELFESELKQIRNLLDKEEENSIVKVDDRRKNLIIKLREELNKFIRLINPFSENSLEGEGCDSILNLILNTDIDVKMEPKNKLDYNIISIMLKNKEVFRFESVVYVRNLHFTFHFYYEEEKFDFCIWDGNFSVSFSGKKFIFGLDKPTVSNDDLELLVAKLQGYNFIIRELIANNSSTKIVGDNIKRMLKTVNIKDDKSEG